MKISLQCKYTNIPSLTQGLWQHSAAQILYQVKSASTQESTMSFITCRTFTSEAFCGGSVLQFISTKTIVKLFLKQRSTLPAFENVHQNENTGHEYQSLNHFLRLEFFQLVASLKPHKFGEVYKAM